MRRLQTVFIFLFLLFIPSLVRATTIVIVLHADYVVMAADSKGTLVNLDSSEVITKIYKSGEQYFSVSNLVRGESFYSGKIILDILDAHPNFDSSISLIKSSMVTALEHELKLYARRGDPFLSFLKDSLKTMTSFVMVGLKDKKPFVYSIYFNISNDDPLKINAEEHFYTAEGNASKVLIIGEREHAKRDLPYFSKIFTNPIHLAYNLVLSEVIGSPKNVGEPIDVITLTPAGSRWRGKPEGPLRNHD